MADEINYHNFSNMHVDLSKVAPGQRVIDFFPELKFTKAYTEASDIEFRLGALMCDPRGPFGKIKQYHVRLDAVCRWLKIDFTGKDKAFYDELLALKNVKVANVWTEYLAGMFEHEWTSWFTNSLLYYQMMEQMRKPIDFNSSKDWETLKTIEIRADGVYARLKKMEEIVFMDEAIKRKAFESKKNLIENFAEKHAQENVIV